MKKFISGRFLYAEAACQKQEFIGEILSRTKNTLKLERGKFKIHSYKNGEFVFISPELISFAK